MDQVYPIKNFFLVALSEKFTKFDLKGDGFFASEESQKI